MEIKDMTRQELFKALKEKAEKEGRAAPFGGSTDELRGMLEGKIPLPEKASVRKRKGRRPLGSFRSKLAVEGYDIPKNKVPRWINDVPGRLKLAEEGSYAFVDDPEKEIVVGEEPLSGRDSLASKVSRIVGTNSDGSPLKAYLMVIDKDLYEEDQREKQKIVDKVEDAINRGAIEGEPGTDGRYIPKDGIKVESRLDDKY